MSAFAWLQLMADRDRLAHQVDGFRVQLDELTTGYQGVVARCHELEREVIRVDRELSEALRIGMAHEGRANDLNDLCEIFASLADEYRHVVDHVASCGGTCQDCRRLAESAVRHKNFDRRALDRWDAYLRLRGQLKHCMPGCGHREHYFQLEVTVGPVGSTPADDIERLFDRVVELVYDERDDADASAIILSGEALGISAEGGPHESDGQGQTLSLSTPDTQTGAAATNPPAAAPSISSGDTTRTEDVSPDGTVSAGGVSTDGSVSEPRVDVSTLPAENRSSDDEGSPARDDGGGRLPPPVDDPTRPLRGAGAGHAAGAPPSPTPEPGSMDTGADGPGGGAIPAGPPTDR